VDTIKIPSRLNGPPDSGHGGAACGLFARSINDQLASVTLHRPPPLDTDIVVRSDKGKVTFTAGGDTIAVAESSKPLQLESLPFLPVPAVAKAATQLREDLEQNHSFPTCFGCGPHRPHNDGLELFAGAVEGTRYHACHWSPGASLSDDGHEVSAWAVWAALDCPSAHAAMAAIDVSTETIVLGRLSVEIGHSIEVGADYEIVASGGERNGRKILSHSAVVAPDGNNLASALAVWITIPLP
jgi:hypothetical protein